MNQIQRDKQVKALLNLWGCNESYYYQYVTKNQEGLNHEKIHKIQ